MKPEYRIFFSSFCFELVTLSNKTEDVKRCRDRKRNYFRLNKNEKQNLNSKKWRLANRLMNNK